MKKETTMQNLMEAGVHYGYSRTRRHPSVNPFLYGSKNGVDIIDLEKTTPQIEAAAKFIAELGAAGKTVLFVGVKPEARAHVIETASLLRQPSVTERWIGGILTNFTEIKRRIQKLEDMKEKRATGEYAKYTKKEQLLMDRELDRLNKYFSGLVGMSKMPEAMLVIDPKKEHIAVLEARKMNIPVIAMGNTDCSIRDIDYPIIANDSSASSIGAILGILKEAFEGNK
jgi:small subunit ribosomal protein S2